LAAVEISPRLFGERGEAEPRMLFIDGRFRAQLVRRRRRVVTHRARRSGSITSMPDSGVSCARARSVAAGKQILQMAGELRGDFAAGEPREVHGFEFLRHV